MIPDLSGMQAGWSGMLIAPSRPDSLCDAGGVVMVRCWAVWIRWRHPVSHGAGEDGIAREEGRAGGRFVIRCRGGSMADGRDV